MMFRKPKLNKAEFVEFLRHRIYYENLARPHMAGTTYNVSVGRIQAFEEMLKFLGEKVEQ